MTCTPPGRRGQAASAVQQDRSGYVGADTGFVTNGQQVGSSMHVDGAAAQLRACVYLTGVARGGGGLTVQPGSHTALFHLMRSEYNYEPDPTFQPALERLAAGGGAAERTGPAGTVIFFHARLAHAAGVNRRPGTTRSPPHDWYPQALFLGPKKSVRL
jgi:ectoine hydroxylase-related dioxygenase (phytanoyl-CoA dioxygenase family)